MIYQAGSSYAIGFNTNNTSGVATNADSLPTATLWRNGVVDAAPGAAVTVTNQSTGDYLATFTVPAGYVAGDEIEVLILATVGGSAGKLRKGFGIVDATIASVKLKTDNLPAAPASETSATTNTNNLLAAIGNQGSGVYCQVNIPPVLERPDAGSETFKVIAIFHDEGNIPADIDAAGNPTVLLYSSATGTSRAGRLSAWTHPSTGRYEATYTNSVGDPLELLQWEISGTVGGVVRRAVPTMQLTDATAIDFTAQDRVLLANIENIVGEVLPVGVAPGSVGGLAVVDGDGDVRAKVTNITAIRTDLERNGGLLDQIKTVVVDKVGSMLEFVSSNWCWKASALATAPASSGGSGDGGLTPEQATQLSETHVRVTTALPNAAPDSDGGLPIKSWFAAIWTANRQTVLDRLSAMIEVVTGVTRLKASALSQAPAGGGGGGGLTTAEKKILNRIAGAVGAYGGREIKNPDGSITQVLILPDGLELRKTTQSATVTTEEMTAVVEDE